MGYAKELYTAAAIKRMATAWMEDNADELAGMELDGEPYYDQGIGCWVMCARDAACLYNLVANGRGTMVPEYVCER